MSDQIGRYEAVLSCWFVGIDVDRVQLDDLLRATEHPGAIIRCYGPPSDVMQVHVMPYDEALGCIAGFISEDE